MQNGTVLTSVEAVHDLDGHRPTSLQKTCIWAFIYVAAYTQTQVCRKGGNILVAGEVKNRIIQHAATLQKTALINSMAPPASMRWPYIILRIRIYKPALLKAWPPLERMLSKTSDDFLSAVTAHPSCSEMNCSRRLACGRAANRPLGSSSRPCWIKEAVNYAITGGDGQLPSVKA